ncbi:MAG: glycosyltransferase family A protein, partial [Verrucomicrobiota bacterium]
PTHPLAVSVIIPSFNYAHYLPESIASVLQQSHPLLELLVVDDGSTDQTAHVVQSFSDPRLRYLPQPNAGLSAARNTGIHHAKFPFIAFLDADDLWHPDFLETVLHQFSTLPDTFSAIATGTIRIDSLSQITSTSHYNASHTRELTVRDFCLRNQPLSSSIVLRRHALSPNLLFNPSLKSSEDRDLWIRLTASGHRFFLIGTPHASIRRHPKNMSKNARRMKDNTQHVLSQAWRHAAVPRSDLPFWLRAFSIHYFLVAYTHFDEGQRAKAILFSLTSFLLYPFFLHPNRVAEPHLFRLRAFAHFLLPR